MKKKIIVHYRKTGEEPFDYEYTLRENDDRVFLRNLEPAKHFIEVWKFGNDQNSNVSLIQYSEVDFIYLLMEKLKHTSEAGMRTIAVFKIRFKTDTHA